MGEDMNDSGIIKKSPLQRFKDKLSFFPTGKFFNFFSLAIIVAAVAITVSLSKSHQTTQQYAAEITTTAESGFNTHMSAINDGIGIAAFMSDVDDLVANQQKWIRLNIRDWEVASTGATYCSPTTIAWNNENLLVYDQAINYAYSKGLKILLVTNTPSFAQGYTQELYNETTYHYHSYLAQRYRGKIAVWQVFNEANIHNYKNYQLISTFDSSYLASLSDVINHAKIAIKEATPSALVTTNSGVYPVNDAAFNTMNQFFDGIKDSLDVLTIDLYPDLNTTEINKFPARIQSLINRYGKDVYVGEFGLCTKGAGFTEQDQIESVTQSIVNFRSSQAKAYLVYEIRDGNSERGLCGGENADTFGIKKTDGTRKSSYAPIMTAFTIIPSPINSPTPTPTPTPAQGLLRVVTNPAVSATITASPSAQSWQWGANWVPFPVGSYYLDVSGISGRANQRFTIEMQNGQTTLITYHTATGAIDTQYFAATTQANTGLLRITTDPPTPATFTVISTTPSLSGQWGMNWLPEPVGSYTLSFTYPYSSINGKPVIIPQPTTIQIENGKVTVVSADLTTGIVTASIQ